MRECKKKERADRKKRMKQTLEEEKARERRKGKGGRYIIRRKEWTIDTRDRHETRTKLPTTKATTNNKETKQHERRGREDSNISYLWHILIFPTEIPPEYQVTCREV